MPKPNARLLNHAYSSHPFTCNKMATTWSKEETSKLIEVWSEGAIQAMLEEQGCFCQDFTGIRVSKNRRAM